MHNLLGWQIYKYLDLLNLNFFVYIKNDNDFGDDNDDDDDNRLLINLT